VSEAARIQAYLQETARAAYEAVPVPPFTAFFHPRDPLRFFNYAIPDEPVGGDLAERLGALREVFRARERLPRFEYIAEFAPDLAAALTAAGFELELRAPLMTCPAGRLVLPTMPAGLEIVAADEDVRSFLTIGRRAFGSGDEPEATDAQVTDWRQRHTGAGTSLLGLLEGEPVAVASATPARDGLSEVAGIAVLENYRARGLGAAMTAAAALDAARRGASLLFLSPGSEGARSVYERVGFRPQETSLYYADPE
jgi:ribosomal protein S18 acetylase RimI-like enzyme